MKKMLPESELARDERFVRSKIEDRIFDPRGARIAARNTGPAKMATDRPAAAERSRSLMHGIFVGEVQALEGAGRTCFDFDDTEAPFQLNVFSTMKEFGNESGDPVLEFCEDWMLADEVTHVKMGSDWLRRLTDKDPERRERALEFQRTVDAIFNLGGFRGDEEENVIQLARRFRELAGFTEEENDSLSALARESTEQAREMAEMATAALNAQSS
jgi:PAS domain-containing protein